MIVNEIYVDNENGNQYRVLWLNPDIDTVYVINLNKINTLPIKISFTLLNQQLNNGECRTLPEQFYHRYLHEEEIKDSHRIIRDKAWNIIRGICTIEPDIYDHKTRGKIIAECAKIHNITRLAVIRYLYRYWQRGCVKHALLPDYNKCGGPEKTKVVNPKIKRGRPRIHRNDKEIGIGINVDEETRKIFIESYKKFYEKSRKYAIEYAYAKMLETYYPNTDGNGCSYLVDKPTKQQFYYWLKKTYNIADLSKKRVGEKEFNLTQREVLHDSSGEATKPGEKFQVDASVFNNYLVACFDRTKVIGFPVVYSVKDVFSRAYVGLYVGLENPSYLGLGMAIYNTARDKVEFCKDFGIEIKPSEWPCSALPTTLLADNGTENICKNSDQITNLLGVNIENAPTGRADLKPFVEAGFHLMKEKITPIVPGYVPDFSKRQGDKYKYDAILTIKEFTAILINLILAYNNSTWIKDYPMDEVMIREKVRPIPIELWNWGVVNRVGYLKKPDMDMVKLACMYSDKATVTEKGIRFKTKYYICDQALQERWFARARMTGYWRIDIAYDPRNLEKIYYKRDGGFEICATSNKGSNKAYENWVAEEIDFYNSLNKLEQEKSKSNYYERQTIFLRESEKIIDNARAEKNKVVSFDKRSKKEKGAVKSNKDAEKQRLREEQKFEISIDKDESPSEIIEPIIKEKGNISFFLRKQQERFMHEFDNSD